MRHSYIYIILGILSFTACATTDRIPEGEQLYLGIKDIVYDTPKHKVKTEETEERGVIADIADAYGKVHDIIAGNTTNAVASLQEIKQKKRSELTREERKRLAAHERAEAENLSVTKEEIEAALNYAPNGALFGSSKYHNPFSIGLPVYNRYADAKSGFGRWMFKTFAEEPILISSVAPHTRAKVAGNTLYNYGYFRGSVDYEIVDSKDPRAARILYNIRPGHLFHLDSVEYRSFGRMTDSLLHATWNKRLLKSGDAFNVVKLSDEQIRIDNLMHEHGYYYWSPSYTTYQADTLQVPGYVQLRVLPKAVIPEKAQHPYYIGKTYVNIHQQRGDTLNHVRKSRRGGTDYAWNGGKDMPIRTRLWRTAINHRKGNLYTLSDQTGTVEKLMAMGLLSSIDVEYVPRDTTALCDTLDIHINTVMGKAYDSAFEAGAYLKSSQQLGPGVSYELTKHNAFRGGENLSWKIYGSYEWQLGGQKKSSGGPLNSFELGSSVTFEFPRFAFPFVNQRKLRFPASTKVAIDIDWRNRSGYFQMINFGTHVGYNWRKGKIAHKWELLNLEYYHLLNTSDEFNAILAENPVIAVAMNDVFSPSMAYSLTYNSGTRHPLWVQWTIKEAGNLCDGLHHLFKRNLEPGEQRKVFNTPYAQYLKTTAEVHYSLPLNERFSLATRFFGGIIWTYGGGSGVPYAEQFYLGGANSIRAFTARSAGPGGYHTVGSKYSYIDQTGDIKLEANVELRTKLIGGLNGAIFLDAGNIWLLREDPLRPNAEISGSNLRHIALGTGAGLRYDLDFLVLRIDVGIGLHAPYETAKTGFYNFERFKDSLAFHLAIGYPF